MRENGGEIKEIANLNFIEFYVCVKKIRFQSTQVFIWNLHMKIYLCFHDNHKSCIKMNFIYSQIDEQNDSTESLATHPKSKEWLISASRANYQELAKLGHEHPQLVRCQVSVKKNPHHMCRCTISKEVKKGNFSFLWQKFRENAQQHNINMTIFYSEQNMVLPC